MHVLIEPLRQGSLACVFQYRIYERNCMSTEPDAQRTRDAFRYRFDEWADRADTFPFLAIPPFERPDLSLARALQRHGTPVAVDVGRNSSRPAQLLDSLRPLCSRSLNGAVGIRIPDHVAITRQQL